MRVLLTGGSGMVGRALRRLAAEIAPWLDLVAPDRWELPLADRGAVAEWIVANQIEAVVHAAARVGGIQANLDDPTGFLAENLRVNDAVIMGAYQAGTTRLINLGSSCMYPRDWPRPLVEEDVLAGPLEPSNEGYALAKITAARLCAAISAQHGRAFRTLISCNLFGPDDHFAEGSAHLVAAAITKTLQARAEDAAEVTIWGSGQARREFMSADHLARFILTSLDRLEALPPLLNVGAGRDHSVDDYYRMIADIVGWRGTFRHDPDRPEGMRSKLMSSDRAVTLGYVPPQRIEPDLRVAIDAARRRLAL